MDFFKYSIPSDVGSGSNSKRGIFLRAQQQATQQTNKLFYLFLRVFVDHQFVAQSSSFQTAIGSSSVGFLLAL